MDILYPKPAKVVRRIFSRVNCKRLLVVSQRFGHSVPLLVIKGWLDIVDMLKEYMLIVLKHVFNPLILYGGTRTINELSHNTAT